MITAATLRNQTVKDLSQMAKKRGLAGWHSMRKDELVNALVRQATRPANQGRGGVGASRTTLKPAKEVKKRLPVPPPASKGVAARASKSTGAPRPTSKPAKRAKPPGPARSRDPRIDQRIQEDRLARQRMKDLSFSPTYKNAASRGPVAEDTPTAKDRLILMVRDAYWLQAYWELNPASIQRAQAALALHWHTAKPVLRVLRLERGPSNTSEHVARDLPIHGGVRNWYVHVDNPPGRYCVEVGYLAANKRFYRLVRSNVVTTPRPGSTEILDGNWTDIAENCEKIFAMSGGYGAESNDGQLKEMLEERLRRPIGPTAHSPFGAGAMAESSKERPFAVQVDAEMIVYGITRPGAYVTMGGEPVKLRADGTFTARVDLPERRQVVPIVASSPDGTDEQTIVLAIERNTKVMEAVTRHAADD